MILKILPIALALALCPIVANAEQANTNAATETSNDWAAWGGTVAVRLNENLLHSMACRFTVARASCPTTRRA